MRIIIELSAEESAAREKWQAQSDKHVDNVDLYDVRLLRIADAALSAARQINREPDFRRESSLFSEEFPVPKLDCEGVDLYYSVESFERGRAAPYRYTMAGEER